MFADQVRFRLRPALLATVLVGAAALAASASAQDDHRRGERETMIDERFSVSNGEMLAVDVGDADVEVTTSDTDEVHVEVILYARSLNERAHDYYERQNFTVEQSGGVVRVATERRNHISWDWGNFRSPDILVRISAPAEFDANVRTSDGDIAFDSMNGEISLRTSDGDVSAGALTGGDLSIATSDGDVAAEHLNGAQVSVTTSDGDISLETLEGEAITARTSDGDINIDLLDGEGEVRTSDGDIMIARAVGPALFARTSDGSLNIATLDIASARLQTSDGDIDVARASGDVTASASDGNIVIGLPEGAGANVALRGDRVRVDGEITIGGELGRDRVEGVVNGGGARIEARTSDGSVTLIVSR